MIDMNEKEHFVENAGDKPYSRKAHRHNGVTCCQKAAGRIRHMRTILSLRA